MIIVLTSYNQFLHQNINIELQRVFSSKKWHCQITLGSDLKSRQNRVILLGPDRGVEEGASEVVSLGRSPPLLGNVLELRGYSKQKISFEAKFFNKTFEKRQVHKI